ncbi:hypothetical protein Tco_1130300 [Tanacetum coccineum]
MRQDNLANVMRQVNLVDVITRNTKLSTTIGSFDVPGVLSHISSLETHIKQHNERAGTLITPIRLTFNEEKENSKEKDEDLKRPYKEVLKSPFTRWIIEFSALSHRMPTNLKIYDGSIDLDDHITRFVRAANQGEANETLPDFKERWTEEMSYIQGVLEVMQILAFMGNAKCPELTRRFADQVSQTVIEMMKRVDDSIKSEEAYKSTELPKGEHPEKGQGTSYRGNRPPRAGHGGGHRRTDNYNTYGRRDHYQPYVPPRAHNRRFMHTVRRAGVAGIKRRRHDLYGDGVRNLATASRRGRLKEDLESSTWRRRQDFKATPSQRFSYILN